jgi:hypothetical protein
MKRLLILAVLATPFAANAQQATIEDKLAASEATNADLLNLTTNLRAQINADQRERADLLKRVAEAEKKAPSPAPTAPVK